MANRRTKAFSEDFGRRKGPEERFYQDREPIDFNNEYQKLKGILHEQKRQ